MSQEKYINHSLVAKDTDNEFSSCPCGWCGSRLAGYRLDCGVIADNTETGEIEEVYEVKVCIDCVEKEFCG